MRVHAIVKTETNKKPKKIIFVCRLGCYCKMGGGGPKLTKKKWVGFGLVRYKLKKILVMAAVNRRRLRRRRRQPRIKRST